MIWSRSRMSSNRTSTTKVRSPIAGVYAPKMHGVWGLRPGAIMPALMIAGMGLFVVDCPPAQAQDRDSGRGPRAENAPDEPRRGERRPERPPGAPGVAERGERPNGRGPVDSPRPPEALGPLRLTEQQKRRVTSFLKEFLPGVLEEIKLLSETNPRHLERELVYLFPRVSVLLRQRDSQPGVFVLGVKLEQLEYAIRRLARETRAKASQNEGSKEEVRKLIGQKFDLELERSALQLAALSHRLEELRDQLARRTVQKEQLVQRELATHLGPAGSPRAPRHRPPPGGEREPATQDHPRPPASGPSEPRSH